MADLNKFSPGTLVKVTHGPFSGHTGVIIDHSKTADGRGNPFPVPTPRYNWVMVTLGGTLFPAHLHDDELEPLLANS